NPDRPGQVEHIFLDLVLNIPKKSFRGTCSIRINPVRSGIDKLTLDAVNLNIKSVKVGEIEQNFDSDGEVLQIKLHEPTEAYQPITIAIEYSVEKPQRGLYFVGPD
ncbi:aminopeptidase, partial [Microcoleus sp. HI-ES]|nr:aminopeptidase [Microcoleus sp. HI-ES]